MTSVSDSVTVGIDIGTTSVKAVAVDATGEALARARIPHRLLVPASDRLEHDAARAWRVGPMKALAQVASDLEVAGVCVCGMVPSLTVVDARGRPRKAGLLYGDARGRPEGSGTATGDVTDMPDALGFLRWATREVPGAYGYWPAQAVANYALGRVPAIDTAMAVSLGSLFPNGQWDIRVLEGLGVTVEQLPRVVPMGEPAGTVAETEAVLTGGTVDALCDQIVSGAEEVGDVLVICGATLVVWAVVGEWLEVPGLYTVPHTVPDRVLVGGPSNAGGLFVDWVRSLLGGGIRRSTTAHPVPHEGEMPERIGVPERVPVWLPYLRGERVPFHDTSLRACVFGLDIAHDAAAIERAAYETTGFVVRQMLDRAGITGRRIVASGGGTRATRWMQAMADAAGLPVDVLAVHEGAPFGAAYLARMAAGLEESLDGSRRWARVGYRVDPDPEWQAAAEIRYQSFLEHSPRG